ncbi:MAG: DUF4836 family protein [Saprospiraceae bacterium]|nr:DUF4836 family protein [Saprospiraceae bacterium]
MKSISILIITFMSTQLLVAQISMQQFISKDKSALIANITPYLTYQKLDTATTNKFKISKTIAPLLIGLADANSDDEAKIAKIQEDLAQPERTGLDIQKEIYIWIQKPDNPSDELYDGESNPMFTNIIIPVTDGAKFRTFLDQLFGKDKTNRVVPTGNTLNLIHNQTLINWNKDRLILSRSTITQSFYDDDSQFNDRITKLLLQHANALSKIDVEQSISKDVNYQKHLHKDSDFDIWMDYNSLMPSSNDIPRQARELYESIIDFVGDIKIGGNGFLNDGKGLFLMEMYSNDALTRVLQETYNQKLNKDFFKYLNNENLMGMYTMAMNPEGLMRSYSAEIYKVLEKTKEGTLITNVLDIIDIFIDEEEIYSLLKGDLLMAFTDIITINKVSTDFEYNEKTDKWDEVQKTSKEVMPLMVMMMSYGNEENLMKFIKLASNAGLISKKTDGVWTIGGAKEEIGVDVFVIVKDGVFMLTNDESVPKNLGSGYAKEKQMNAKDIKDVSTHVQYGFIDIDKLAENGKKVSKEMGINLPTDIAEAHKTFKRLEFKTSHPEGNETTTEFSLSLSDSETNVLQTIFDVGLKWFSLAKTNVPESAPIMEDKNVKKL